MTIGMSPDAIAANLRCPFQRAGERHIQTWAAATFGDQRGDTIESYRCTCGVVLHVQYGVVSVQVGDDGAVRVSL